MLIVKSKIFIEDHDFKLLYKITAFQPVHSNRQFSHCYVILLLAMFKYFELHIKLLSSNGNIEVYHLWKWISIEIIQVIIWIGCI